MSAPGHRPLMPVVCGALLSLVLVGCGSSAVSQAARTATGPVSAATPTITPVPSTSEVVPEEMPRAVFLGDSYTVGVGSSGEGYVPDVAAGMGWIIVNAGESGTGYLSPGFPPDSSPYADRVPDVVATDPDVVVVQGSTNDVGQDPAAVGAAAVSLYGSLTAALPDARVVVVGPLAPPSVDLAAVSAIRDALAAAAGRLGLPFIDPIAGGWLQPADGLYVADALHPDDAGYTQLAEDLVPALQGLGL